MGEERNNRGTQLSQILLCVLVFIFACCAIVFVALYFIKYGEDNASDDDMPVSDDRDFRDLCTTEACVRFATTILNNADLSLDPCEDFYEYACSNYIRYTQLPESDHTGVLQEISQGLDWRLKALLENDYNPGDFPKPVNDALNFYKGCINEDNIEDLNLAPIEDMVNFYGGFPAVDPNWDPDNFDLTDAMAKLIRTMLSFSMFFSANVNLGFLDTSKYDIVLEQYFPMLPREVLLEDRNSTLIMAYEHFAVEVAVLMGADRAIAEADMKAMVDWEVELAPNLIPSAEWGNPDDVAVFTIQELYDNITDKIDWKRYFDTIFQDADITFSLNDTVELRHRIWFDRLVEKLDTFDKRNLANNMMVRLIFTQRDALPKAFRDLAAQYLLARWGSTFAQPRWLKCTQLTNGFMQWAVGRLYVEEIFDDAYQEKVDEMLRLVREVMGTMLDEASWMDEATRAKAKLKLTGLNEQVGYPEYLLNDERLQRFYPGLVVDPNDFLFSMRAMHEAWKLDFLLRQGQPSVPGADWFVGPSRWDARYFDQGNTMIFTAAFFTEPIFHIDNLNYVNFGLAGAIMGHEVTHAFDNRGRRYDENGNLVDWWDDQTAQIYKNRSQCLVDQYSQYEIQGQNVDGSRSLEENMADNGGVIAGLRAYKLWLKENGINREPKLPGIDLTPYQLYFLSNAQLNCFTGTDEFLVNTLGSIYAPHRYRVNGPVSNIPEFAKAFNCPANSPMNPSEKCAIWNEL